jgi:hypothetical protein
MLFFGSLCRPRFSFKFGDAQEDSRLVVLEDKDCEAKVGREFRSGVKLLLDKLMFEV